MEETSGKNARLGVANWGLTIVSEACRHTLSFCQRGTSHSTFHEQRLSDG